MSPNEEDALMYKPVKTDSGRTGLLITICTDGYDTTVGPTKAIEASDEDAEFTGEYALYLPVDWKKKVWLFPDGRTGHISVDLLKPVKYKRVEDNTEWDCVTCTDYEEM